MYARLTVMGVYQFINSVASYLGIHDVRRCYRWIDKKSPLIYRQVPINVHLPSDTLEELIASNPRIPILEMIMADERVVINPARGYVPMRFVVDPRSGWDTLAIIPSTIDRTAMHTRHGGAQWDPSLRTGATLESILNPALFGAIASAVDIINEGRSDTRLGMMDLVLSASTRTRFSQLCAAVVARPTGGQAYMGTVSNTAARFNLIMGPGIKTRKIRSSNYRGLKLLFVGARYTKINQDYIKRADGATAWAEDQLQSQLGRTETARVVFIDARFQFWDELVTHGSHSRVAAEPTEAVDPIEAARVSNRNAESYRRAQAAGRKKYAIEQEAREKKERGVDITQIKQEDTARKEAAPPPEAQPAGRPARSYKKMRPYKPGRAPERDWRELAALGTLGVLGILGYGYSLLGAGETADTDGPGDQDALHFIGSTNNPTNVVPTLASDPHPAEPIVNYILAKARAADRADGIDHRGEKDTPPDTHLGHANRMLEAREMYIVELMHYQYALVVADTRLRAARAIQPYELTLPVPRQVRPSAVWHEFQ